MRANVAAVFVMELREDSISDLYPEQLASVTFDI